MIKNLKILCILLALTIISLSVVSAQTLIAGKVYNSDYSNTIDGADISVTCNSYSLDTNTLEDGTYAVRFEETQCNEGDSVSVSASKSGFQEKTGSGTVIKCEDADCNENYVMIINLGMSIQTYGGHSGGNSGRLSRYYLCGNGLCDSGETINTCPEDCKNELLTQTSSTQESEEETETGITLTENEDNENSAGITGAVIGALGSGGYLFVIVFVLGVIVLAITTFIIRKRKKI